MRIIPLTPARRPDLSPDIVFDGVTGDFALAGDDEIGNRGGLRAREALRTAVVICLLTDARVDAHEITSGDANRGWPGDSFDLADAETPIGSKLWLLRRRAIDDDIGREAEDHALASLQPLIDQGAAAKATAAATVDRGRNRLDLAVELTDRDGTILVAEQFRVLWDELDRVYSADA